MRWFHWTVEQFMEVYNPPNAEVTPLYSSHPLLLITCARAQVIEAGDHW